VPHLHNPRQNQLLAALPTADYSRLLPELQIAPFPLGWPVYETGGRLYNVYFPTTVRGPVKLPFNTTRQLRVEKRPWRIVAYRPDEDGRVSFP
jgi:hypothetical protein